ncbi:hypothetical protein J3R30DRAFT_1567192 [Lentinula aciculospora]|uniref:Uncharacterized protein n=1 Tax=Lentinula aciculospora TaxID=153920 RepID=A0A9W8ZXS7_9AGAR|nr:hypothetical protein J3R30DRAFT_1567192 [Lentinula aciculospora]
MQEYDKYENLHENLNSSTEESSGTDSGVDFRSTKKYGVAGVGTRNPEDRGHRGLGMGRTLHLPVDDIPPPLPEKDKLKSSRTKHLSHLPLVITAPSDPHSSRTKGRSRTTRSYSVSSTPPATLVKLLRAQESTTKETKVLLNAALSQLDAASARAAKAEAQFHARETSAILSHTQFTENVARLEEAAARARREAEAYKLQLRLRDEEVKKEKEKVRTEERMRAEAEKEAERARSLARRWREEGRVMKAKEDGRKEGFGEGLQRGRLVIAAAIAAKESSSDDRRLVGDGAAYIEEYEESEYPRRRAHSRSRASRSKRSEPSSAHRRERVNSSSKRHEPTPQYVPTFSALPPEPIQEPPPLIPESAAVIIRRARSIQTDPSLFQSERTRSLASSSSHSRQQQSGPSHVFVQESSPQPPVYNDRSPTPEEEETVKSESFSPEIPPTPQQLDPSPIPIPIPPPISQVPFAPGIVPPSSQYGQYPPPEPAPVQPAYFPMPAPPIVRVIVTPADEDRDVQTPSTITSMTNENSSGGLGLLHGLPPPSRTGSAASAASADPGRFDGGTFDPDLSTIHEHSREGTAFGGEEDFSNAGGVMTPDRSRNVEQWRRSLGLGGQPYSLAATQSPAVDPSNDLLRPPSSNSGSRRPRPQPLDLDRDRRLSSRSGSTSSRSININVEPPVCDYSRAFH